MGKVHCAGCPEEIRDEDAFRHQGKNYCPKCTIALLRSRYASEFSRAQTFRSV